MNDKKQNLAHVVHDARIDHGLSQEKLAEILNIDQRTILNIEAGRGNPKFEKLFAIVTYLRIPGDNIFYLGSDISTPNHQKLLTLLKTCTEQEAEFILPVVRSLLEVLHKNKGSLQ